LPGAPSEALERPLLERNVQPGVNETIKKTRVRDKGQGGSPGIDSPRLAEHDPFGDTEMKNENIAQDEPFIEFAAK
jgi:hypothetical protein